MNNANNTKPERIFDAADLAAAHILQELSTREGRSLPRCSKALVMDRIAKAHGVEIEDVEASFACTRDRLRATLA